jgi:hypothetical protein
MPKADAFKKALSKSPRMVDRAVQLLSRTWNYIGDDVLRAHDTGAMSRDEVIEVVLDADHYYSGDDWECAEWFKQQESEVKVTIARMAFQDVRYSF